LNQNLIKISSAQLARTGLDQLPVTIIRAGENAAWRFLEFFTANIRNRNTRLAYARAIGQFFHWCERRRIRLEQIHPSLIAAYIEQHSGEPPTIKQHLAAIRMLFDLAGCWADCSIQPCQLRSRTKACG
jgi:site-specific recombinase XerD